MAEVQLDTPDEQLNYAIKLIINAYETKSQLYENEIRRLNEEFDQRANEYENNLRSLSKEKEYLEEKIEKEMKDNKELSLQIEIITNENKKLEKFKNSILNSINDNPSIGGLLKDNSISTSHKNFNSTPVSTNNSRYEQTTTKITTVPNLMLSKSLNKQGVSIKPTEKVKINEIKTVTQLNTSQVNKVNSTPVYKDNRIESLIDKLNESINNRIYDDNDKYHVQIFNSLNRFNHTQSEINRKIEETKSKTYSNYRPHSHGNHESRQITEHVRSSTPNNNNKKIDYNSNLKNKEHVEIESLSRGDESFEEEENSFSDNTDNKSNQYVQSSKFFADCRAKLKTEEYAKLIETLKLCNNNKIDKFEAFSRIESLLQNNAQLLKEFKTIFPTS